MYARTTGLFPLRKLPKSKIIVYDFLCNGSDVRDSSKSAISFDEKMFTDENRVQRLTRGPFKRTRPIGETTVE